MSDQTAILCIGGPLNGQMIADDQFGPAMAVKINHPSRPLRAADLADITATATASTTLYHRAHLKGERCTFTIWRHESLPPDAVLRLLLTSYQLNTEKEPTT